MNLYLRYSLMVLGCIFLLIGIIGLFVPILQGIIFLAIGLYVLSLTSRRLKRTIKSHLQKYPRVHTVYLKYSAKIERIFDLKK